MTCSKPLTGGEVADPRGMALNPRRFSRLAVS